MQALSQSEFDHIVVGAGAAGCALAGRLSSDPRRSVLLIEAGADICPGEEPADIRDAYPAAFGNPAYLWTGLRTENGADLGSGRGRIAMPYPQGRILGGGSSINGMVSQRGLPGDFEEWQSLGAEGWGWDGVLPLYKRLENDLDYDGSMHGREGPMPIRRHRREQWPPFAAGVGRALEAMGHRCAADLNADPRDGLYPLPMNNLPDRRVSSASAYLTAEVRRRPNLRVLTSSTVERILFAGRRAAGVAVRTPEGMARFEAKEIILAAGALFSPSILMRSGVGPAETLSQLGIALVADRPGVGRNLQNHPQMYVAVHLPRHAVQAGAIRAAQNLALRYSSGHEGCPGGDMYLFPLNKAAWHPLGRRIGSLGYCVLKPFSRGTVTLCDPDPQAMPEVKVNLLSDVRDFARMVGGLRLMLSILTHPAVTAHRNEIFHPQGVRTHSLNRRTLANFCKTWCAAHVMDLSPSLRRRLLGDVLPDPEALMRDEDALARKVREHSQGTGHVCGTCKIGRASDPEAVVDPSCRVYGVEGLRVADTSVMPTIVRAPTHLTAVMIGEKVADMVEAQSRGSSRER